MPIPNFDQRKCPQCGEEVHRHPAKGQRRNIDCSLSRGKVCELLAEPRPFNFKKRTERAGALTAELATLTRSQLEEKYESITGKKPAY